MSRPDPATIYRPLLPEPPRSGPSRPDSSLVACPPKFAMPRPAAARLNPAEVVRRLHLALGDLRLLWHDPESPPSLRHALARRLDEVQYAALTFSQALEPPAPAA
jgi:hypothetical protein